MSKLSCCRCLRNCAWMAYWESMSWNTSGPPLSFPRLPSCYVECPHSRDGQACQKKGGEGFARRNGIQKKPAEMDISLRQNWAFQLDTPLVIVLTGTSKDGQSNCCRRENREWRTQTEDTICSNPLDGQCLILVARNGGSTVACLYA